MPNGKGCGGGHNDESPNVGEEVEVKDARGLSRLFSHGGFLIHRVE